MIRPSIEALPVSRIREVANAGLGRTDVLKFWFGEGDHVTPEFIRAAAKAALDAGETFYNHNLGIAELRETLAAYCTRLHRPEVPVTADRIAVTSAGVHALALVDQALIDPGDRVVIVTPVWPNLTSMPRIMSANVVRVALDCRGGQWTLDLQRLLDAATPDTRLVLVNSPNNPTGWTMPQRDWDALLAHCRRHGIWLVSDDAYERLVFEPGLTIDGHAPGVQAQLDDEDRVISANTFSKSWTMTGWRLGWLVLPAALVPAVEKLAQNLFICPSTLAQHAALACFESESIATYEQRRAEFRARRDFLVPALESLGLPVPVMPDGAFYAWADCSRFVADTRDPARGGSWQFADELMRGAHVAVTPGRDFGRADTARYVRFSYANSMAQLTDAVRRLGEVLPAMARP